MAYPDKIKQAEYQKEYYAQKKDVIKGKLMEKEKCPYCNRVVAHQNMFKHQKSKYCKSRYELAQKRVQITDDDDEE
jgi:uncharacterized protein (DUF1919 family)